MKIQFKILASLLILIAVLGVVPTVVADNDAVSTESPVQVANEGDSFPTTLTDATGTKVTLNEQPERVTTTNPSAAQIMWELDAEDQVVGLSQYASYLEGAETRTNVSAEGFGVNVERVVGTNPDLVLAPNATSAETVKKIRETGVTVYHFRSATSFDNVSNQTQIIGELTGNEQAAHKTNKWVTANIESISNATENVNQPQLLYPLLGGFAVGDETFINQIIVTGGAKNVAANKFNGYQRLSDEVVLDVDPEVLLITDQTAGQIMNTEPYSLTQAGNNSESVRLNVNYLNQPAPRSVVYSTRNLTKQLHPEQYNKSDYISREEITNNITATVSQKKVIANGSDTLKFVLTINDADSNPISDANISVTDTGDNINYISNGSYQTNTNGIAMINATSQIAQENITFSFTEQETGTTTTIQATFEAGKPSTITATAVPERAVADGDDPIKFFITVRDASNNPVRNALVTVNATETDGQINRIENGDTSLTNETGVVEFTANSVQPGTITVLFNETDAGSDSATVEFVETEGDDSDDRDSGGGGGSSSTSNNDEAVDDSEVNNSGKNSTNEANNETSDNTKSNDSSKNSTNEANSNENISDEGNQSATTTGSGEMNDKNMESTGNESTNTNNKTPGFGISTVVIMISIVLGAHYYRQIGAK